MFHTLTDIQKGEAIGLLEPIDNSDGKLRVGLRQLTYTVGWFNFDTEETFSRRDNKGQFNTESQVKISPGLWSFSALRHLVGLKGVKFEAERASGKFKLTVNNGWEVRISDGLLEKLGLDDGKGGDWLAPDTYLGDRPMNLNPFKCLHIHLEQLNTTRNFENGERSTLLAILPVSCNEFGEQVSVRFEYPDFKRLCNGSLTELNITVRDDDGKLIDNHGLPITAVLKTLRVKDDEYLRF